MIEWLSSERSVGVAFRGRELRLVSTPTCSLGTKPVTGVMQYPHVGFTEEIFLFVCIYFLSFSKEHVVGNQFSSVVSDSLWPHGLQHFYIIKKVAETQICSRTGTVGRYLDFQYFCLGSSPPLLPSTSTSPTFMNTQTHTPSVSFQKETVSWSKRRRDCLQSYFHSRIIDECILLIYQLNYFICYLTLSLCSNILHFSFKTCSKSMWERKVFFSVPLFDPHYQMQIWQSPGRSHWLNRSYSIPGEGSRLRLYRKQSQQKVSLLTQVAQR